MVSSTAIPKAMENVIAVDGRKMIPDKPITPPANISGITFGKMDNSANFFDLNKNIMEKKI